MEFSSEILIESGLNLAGYLVVAALLYILMSRRMPKRPKTAVPPAGPAVETTTPLFAAPSARQRSADASVFVPLTSAASAAPSNSITRSATPDQDAVERISRRENRRAIYREARRLLALGNSRRELMDKFPLTEDEIELLSVTGKA
jgi:hypothetical protein